MTTITNQGALIAKVNLSHERTGKERVTDLSRSFCDIRHIVPVDELADALTDALTFVYVETARAPNKAAFLSGCAKAYDAHLEMLAKSTTVRQ
jgi:hypothetical protein